MSDATELVGQFLESAGTLPLPPVLEIATVARGVTPLIVGLRTRA